MIFWAGNYNGLSAAAHICAAAARFAASRVLPGRSLFGKAAIGAAKKGGVPPKNFAWIPSRGPPLCLEVDALGLVVFGFLLDALLFDEVIDGLRLRRRFGLFFGALF